MRYTFLQLSRFAARWKQLGLIDEDLQALEALLRDQPEKGAVVQGTGGLRKLRFAPPSWRSGKSGATRVIYIVFVEAAFCYLFNIFAPRMSSRASVQRRRQKLERRSTSCGRYTGANSNGRGNGGL